nr:HipA N-terminal domain-containing protein [Photobacterium kishitanii]
MNGILVGTLSKASSGAISFQYHSTWLTRAGSRAISLSMPLRQDPYHGDIPYNFLIIYCLITKRSAVVFNLVLKPSPNVLLIF